jgi:glycerol-3-phosphate acyltransferase PlsY
MPMRAAATARTVAACAAKATAGRGSLLAARARRYSLRLVDVLPHFSTVAGFLLGSVPFAWLIVRLCKGIDVRTVGSGNVGATNASRAFAGKGSRLAVFLLIYLLDAGKGVAAVLLAGVRQTQTPPHLDVVLAWTPELGPMVAAGAAAVLGHVFTPWLGWRGGKGVATATGVMFALDWQVTLIALAVFFVVRFTTGHVFLGSLALGAALAGASIALHPSDAFTERRPVTVLCLLLAVLIVWTHRSNLKKHFGARPAGTE